MNDRANTKEQLISQLAELRHRIVELEASEAERKRAEERLRQERDRAQEYLDIAGVMFVVINPKEEVALINEKGCETLGYKQGEIIGKNWFDNFLPARMRNEAKSVFQKLMAEEVAPVEYFENPVLTKSGEERMIAWHNTVLTDEEGNIIGTLSSGNDITERKRAEEELRLHSEIMTNMVEGVILTRTSDGTIIYTNPKFEEMLGYGHGELVRKNISVVNAPTQKSPEEIAKDIQRSLKKTGVWSGEVYNIKKDGTPFWCYANVSAFEHAEYGKVWVAVHTDITERKRAEEALRESKERYRSLFENSIEGVFAVDLDGNFTSCNKAYAELYGYTTEELVGASYKKVVAPENAELVFKEYNKLFRTGEPIRNLLYEVITKSGERRLLEGYANVIRERDRIVGFQGTSRDINHRAQAGRRDAEEVERCIQGYF